MNTKIENYILNNGIDIPSIAYGTYLIKNNEVAPLVLEAFKNGYRHIDTAFFYDNEKGIGEALQQSTLSREDYFITSKVWNDDRGYETTKKAFLKSLENLGLDYLDLYLIHWPATKKQFGADAKTINAETWRAFEELYRKGKVRSIGVSNFTVDHLKELKETTEITPMVNQVEMHPGWPNLELLQYCEKENILVEAWSPLGRGDVLENDTLKMLAQKYDKSTSQICLRWVLQHNALPLPKTTNTNRMQANLDIYNFTISKEDMKIIDELKNIGGKCYLPDEIDF